LREGRTLNTGYRKAKLIVEVPKEPLALPPHVGEALQAIANMQIAHQEQASFLARLVDRTTATAAKPVFLIYVGAAVMVWTGANALLARAGLPVLDAPPFAMLELLVSCAALFIAVLILASQRRADILANLRQHMTLEVALLTNQKTSKLVELIEEFRRDSPDVRDRVDVVAMEMADAPDHGTVLQAVQQMADKPQGIGVEGGPGLAS
jgi:uncharacterized membrane protein